MLLDGEKCVQKISSILNLNQSTCSHQLKLLKQYKLVKARREGKFIRYSLDDEHIEKIIKIGDEHVKGDK